MIYKDQRSKEIKEQTLQTLMYINTFYFHYTLGMLVEDISTMLQQENHVRSVFINHQLGRFIPGKVTCCPDR